MFWIFVVVVRRIHCSQLRQLSASHTSVAQSVEYRGVYLVPLGWADAGGWRERSPLNMLSTSLTYMFSYSLRQVDNEVSKHST